LRTLTYVWNLVMTIKEEGGFDIENKFEQFCDIEKSQNIFEHTIHGVLIWKVMRKMIWRKLSFTGEKKKALCRGNNLVLKTISSLAKLVIKFIEASYFTKQHQNKSCQYPYLFYGLGAGRRKLANDGLYWDIYCDPIIDVISEKKCLLIEQVTHDDDYKLVSLKTRNIFAKRTDSVSFSDALVGIFAVLFVRKEELLPFRDIEGEINKKFQQDINIHSIVKKYLLFFIATRRYWRRFLKKNRPKLIFVVCSYGKESFISAAKELSIPVVELQHGIIDKMHVGYSFSEGIRKDYFPDYMFSYGEFWKDTAIFPIDRERVIPIGNPWFELTKPAYQSELVKQKQILFISQPTIGAELSQHAVRLRSLIPKDWRILYKLHPLEICDWKNIYFDLDIDGIDVIEDSNVDFYKLQTESAIQVGVYSTALYEGAVLGCRTFILDIEGWQHVRPLIEFGAATKVNDCLEISLDAENDPIATKKIGQEIFSVQWETNLDDALKNLLAS
jgi:hypothetical protein